MAQSLFWRFLCHPMQVGALCPSSIFLSRAITTGIGLEEARTVVELGPGTGAITRSIVPRLSGKSRFLAMELDGTLCEALRRSYPSGEFYNASASALPGILAQSKLSGVDVIVSGLPWAIFPEQLQREILQAIAGSLNPNGCFTTFAYVQGVWLPTGRLFRRLLNEYFSEVTTTRVVWCNLPPAFSYRCRGPRGGKE